MTEEEDRFAGFFMSAALRGLAQGRTQTPTSMLLACVDVLDSLDRLVEAAERDQALALEWRGHLAAVRRELVAAFELGGLRLSNSVGEPFDPLRHEAVDLVVREDLHQPMVLAQYARGCIGADGGVLRCARVRVGRGPTQIF